MAISSADVNVLSLLAFIVSLIALTCSLVQLTLSVFGTAEGSRRCQRSVIGPWAKLNHWKPRVRELRFEMKYTTPEISLLTQRELKEAHHEWGRRYILRSDDSVPAHISESVKESKDEEELVTWLALLNEIYKLNRQQWRANCTPTTPLARSRDIVTLEGDVNPPRRAKAYTEAERRINEVGVFCRQRTWDFMPPDVVRPLATAR